MIGAAVIPTDPIFQGLAISLLFGLASSTLLTVLVIPAIYVALRGGRRITAGLNSGKRRPVRLRCGGEKHPFAFRMEQMAGARRTFLWQYSRVIT